MESGKDLKNVDWIGQSDPYFKVSICVTSTETCCTCTAPGHTPPQHQRNTCLQLSDFNGSVIGGNDGGDKAKSAVIENNLSPSWQETHIFLVSATRPAPYAARAMQAFFLRPLQLDKQVDRFKIRVKDEGMTGGKEIVSAAVLHTSLGCLVHSSPRRRALPPSCWTPTTSTARSTPWTPRALSPSSTRSLP